MRKINTIITILIILLLCDHLLFGSLYMLGTGAGVITGMAHTLILLVIIHALISMIVTLRAEKAGFKTKARYNRENREFWLRRTSGVCVLVFALMHAYSMQKNERGIPNIAFMPKIFELTLVLLLISAAVHMFVNIRPLLISLGVRNIDRKERIIRFVFIVFVIFGMASYAFFCISSVLRGSFND